MHNHRLSQHIWYFIFKGHIMGLWLQWFSLCFVNGSHSFLCPLCSFGFVYAEERGSCGGSRVRSLCSQESTHCHGSHSSTRLIQAGMGSSVSSFDLFKMNILLWPTVHNVLINFIYNFTTLYIMYVQIYVYKVAHCIVSRITNQKYIHVLSPNI